MSRWLIEPVCSSSRSASVDLPWSMWAMMQKFLTSACFVATATVRMLGIVAAVLVIGVLLAIAGVVLLVNLFGAGDFVIRTVTSKYLGSLPPGYAASKRGFRIYAVLVLAVGLVCAGFGLTGQLLPVGAGLIVVGALIFGIASVIAITGEVGTARGGSKGGQPPR